MAKQTDYQKGHAAGLDDAGYGLPCAYACKAGAVVMKRTALIAEQTVAPEGLEYARGYLDGYAKAQDCQGR